MAHAGAAPGQRLRRHIVRRMMRQRSTPPTPLRPARAWSIARALRPAVQMFWDRLTPAVAPSLSLEELETWVSGTPSLLVSTNWVTVGKSLRV